MGQLVLFEDCLFLEFSNELRQLAIWPLGSTWESESQKLVLSNGTEIPLGEFVNTGGSYRRPSSLTSTLGTSGVEAAERCNEAAEGDRNLEVLLMSGLPDEITVGVN